MNNQPYKQSVIKNNIGNCACTAPRQGSRLVSFAGREELQGVTGKETKVGPETGFRQGGSLASVPGGALENILGIAGVTGLPSYSLD
ncbi:Hypothetical predicted protein [Podarcis lilfordi]|uniref:Uncharacterized protein n=1 Tax=Podarcis lilfordi TaxID=74358 RepID=A0AA35L475_9SAUR|nr:Hypothetical predicted protein [Podarcis lilfordi]